MLITEKVIQKWNSKTKKHYVDLGYKFTRMKDSFEVSVNHLTKGSCVMVEFSCDYCGKICKTPWHIYISNKAYCKKDSCAMPDCEKQKAKEVLIIKYGSNSPKDIPGLIEKREKTNVAKYGATNPFASEVIKQKIYETNYKKYGVKIPTQNDAIKKKCIDTTLKKYGVNYYIEKFKGKFIRENSPTWKGGRKITPRNRQDYKYKTWREAVFKRDEYICQKCRKKGDDLVAHHIHNWKDFEDLRYEVSNGITLCLDCHKKFHKKYSNFNNNDKQILEFINQDEKIC